MRILELSLRNFRVFEEVDLELPARVIGIFGENGSGKSTLMESIAFGLYGVNATRTKRNQIRTHGVLVDCEVRIAFEHAGQPYEVRRSIAGKGHAPDAQLFGGGLQLAAGTTDVDAEVRRLLHMDLHVFRSSVFAEQKQLDAFSDLTAGGRKEMALRLLGIKPVDEARAAARREARATKDSAQQLEGAVTDLAALEAELKGAREAAAEAKDLARAAAAELKGATAAHRAATKVFGALDAARQRVEKLTVQLTAKTGERDRLVERRQGLAERVEALTAELAELPALQEELEGLDGVEDRLRAATRLAETTSKLAEAERQAAALPAVDAEAALAELRATQAALGQAQEAAAAAQAERAHRTGLLAEAEERLARAAEADPTQACPTCGRPLGEDFAGYLRHCRSEVTAAKRAAAEADKLAKRAAGALAAAEEGHRAAAEAGERAREAGSRLARLQEQVLELRAEVQALAEPFAGEEPDLEALRAGAARATAVAKKVAELGARRDHLEQVRQDHDAAAETIEALERELASLAEESEGLAFDAREHARVRDELAAAETTLADAREVERRAGDAAKDAEGRVAELTGEVRQAKETAARVDELRSEARYVERVGMLLDGFRNHLVARIGPELSREAEALFRELTNHEYDDLKVDEETLTIQIADGDEYFPIDRFSGSETDLANLALRVAISTQLSRMSGADVGMMVLDEVLASLDEERKDLMVQTLGRLSSRFHQLFVITHAERVKDQFPATILIRKTGRRRSVAELV
ncbi:MAG TPA: SMC family ATPase [Actinomycetota bacterium]|nr:SMC family ATPase [Actinomycetota bacterium]